MAVRRGKGQVCFYCKRTLEATRSHSCLAATKDHYVPARAGGRQKVWCCRFCNTLKGGVSPQVWLEFMIATPRWWEKQNATACNRFRRRHHHRCSTELGLSQAAKATGFDPVIAGSSPAAPTISSE
jgi:hypothetical protein